MSPKTYWFLWILVVVGAGILWLAGMMTMLAVVVFGFIAFGMTFMGMMCVLPAVVSHPTPNKTQIPVQKKVFNPAPEKHTKTASGLSAYRHA